MERKFEAPINPDDKIYYEEKAKEPIYRSTKKGSYYCVLRVGKSFKTLGQITQFEKHTERMQDTPNADPMIENKILIGDVNLAEKVQEYISDARYTKSNTTIAREMLLTASHDYFKGMPQVELDQWVNHNIKWLKDKYGDNVLYATLHLDERTPHIHVLLCPKIYSEARKCYVMSSYKLFGDKYKLRKLQDDYAKSISERFPVLQRGIRNSKARHIEIRHFYGVINNVRARENAEEIFKHDILLKSKVKDLEGTLEAYRELLKDKDKNLNELQGLNKDMQKQIKDIKKNNEMYKKVVKQLSITYKIPQNAIEKIMKYVSNTFERK